jgi:dTMP kinase
VFITFEGIGGAGKTTQTELLREALAGQGREVVVTHEPGSTALGERLRAILTEEAAIEPWAEAALFAASRAQLVREVLAPALARGADVLSDRYIDSSLAYQGIGRGLGVDQVLDLNLRVTGGVLPDLTFLLVVDVEDARRRRNKVDEIEKDDPEFLGTVQAAYQELASIFPGRIKVIDSSGPVDDVAKEVRDKLPGLS